MADKELSQIKKEINSLKKKYERALALSSSYEERNMLMNKIAQLEAVKKSPSQMKSFGATFSRGFKTVGKGLWGSIKRGSRNLSANSPEFREMENKKQSYKQPFSSLASMYLPSPVQSEPLKQMKMPKQKKSKKLKARKGFRITSKASNPMQWDLP